METKTQLGKKLKYLRFDNEGEFKFKEFVNFYKHKDVSQHFTIPYAPQQHGVVEKMNMILLENGRCMRLENGRCMRLNARLPKIFLAKIVK